ncbi:MULTISPECIES: hypothetical protein [Rhizobium]|uniref:PAC domain-containing protein n=1 Tax=Rhizobium metallidurans TaxID=1265931 RepID=A0A7W6CTS1_9HYPH|nr:MULTISPECIES: hypothetical protein [Rhizobium]MBB3966990.1 hypothetical protein [Rhizobium metallidurans]
MQRFILRQNIDLFRARLLEPRNDHDTHFLKVMLSQALRDLAILEAVSGFGVEVDPLHAEVQRRIFRDSFEHSSKPHLLLDPRKGLHIVDINTAYEKATLTSAAKVAGSCMFDVFPDNPSDEEADGVSNLYASLKHAAEDGVSNAMRIQRYDVRDASGLFVTKFWKPVNTPIFDAEGRLIYLLHQVEDVTEAIQKKMTEAAGSPEKSSRLIQRNDCLDTSHYPFVRRQTGHASAAPTSRHQQEEHSEEITAPRNPRNIRCDMRRQQPPLKPMKAGRQRVPVFRMARFLTFGCRSQTRAAGRCAW